MKLGSESGAVVRGETLATRIANWSSECSQVLWRRWSASRVEHLLMAACVLLGLWLRWRGAFDGSIPLWVDEEAWAYRLMHQPLATLAIRPLGFMALSRWIVQWLGPTETALRLVPWVAGASVPFLAIILAKRSLESAAARVFLVAVFALHPLTIDFSKEFKPYACSLWLHLACLIAGLAYHRSGRSAWLWAALAMTFFGVLFAQDVVFLMPSLCGVLFLSAFHRRRTAHMAALVGGALLSMALIALLYWFIWSAETTGGESESTLYWAHVYDVFYIPSAGSRLLWLARKLFAVAAWAGMRRVDWAASDLVIQLDSLLWCALTLLGVVSLGLRRRWVEVTLLLAPASVCLLFNQLGFWPFGVFRTNLFLLAYLIPLGAHALELGPALARRFAVFRRFTSAPAFAGALWTVVPTGLLVLLPFLCQDNWHTRKDNSFLGTSYFTDAARKLVALAETAPATGRAMLLMDQRNCHGYRYQLGMNPRYNELAQRFAEHYRVKCIGDARLWKLVHRVVVHQRSPAWVITAHWGQLQPILKAHRSSLRVKDRFAFGPDELVLFRALPTRAR